MKRYTIIGGVNGVGKSSLTGVLVRQTNNLGTIIDVDLITAKLGGNKLKGGKRAVALINECLEKGVDFTQETTLSGRKTLSTVIAAREKNYYICLYYVAVSTADESLSRIENRVRKGGHSIPADDVKRRYQKRFEDLAAILPYCNESHFYDNENGFAEVGEYRCGKLLSIGDYRPHWFTELNDYLADK